MFTSCQSEKAGNLANIGNLARVPQPRGQVGCHNPTDPWNALEQSNILPQFRIVLAEAANLLSAAAAD